MMGSADNLSNPSFEDLLLAMAPLEVVFSSFVEGCRAKNDSRNNDSDQKSSFQGSWYSVEAQDQYAQLLGSNWNTFGPSERYLRKLVRYYVKRVEETPGAHLESDDLLSVVLKTSLKSDSLPNAEESCYLTFSVPDSNSNELLRIRVFPHHNDVALRLWEAGACLAEFFLDNPIYVNGKHVVELGAGVGCTGLVAAGCCDAASVFLTDYTDACRINLEHNLQVNQSWLSSRAGGPPDISQGYLEWSAFADSALEEVEVENFALSESMDKFAATDLLIAADVIYDHSVIESLVIVVRSFLKYFPSKRRQAIFALTKRNMATFQIFLEHLQRYDISCEWLARGPDCENLPRAFPCKFVQPRSDVCIASLTLMSSIRT